MEGPVPQLYGDRVVITARVVITPRVLITPRVVITPRVASGFSRKDVAVRD